MIETISTHAAVGFSAGEGASITAHRRAGVDVEPRLLAGIPASATARVFANLAQDA